MDKVVGIIRGKVVQVQSSTDIAAEIARVGRNDSIYEEGTAKKVMDFITDIEYLAASMRRGLVDIMDARERHNR